jgi:hypothetical protein
MKKEKKEFQSSVRLATRAVEKAGNASRLKAFRNLATVAGYAAVELQSEEFYKTACESNEILQSNKEKDDKFENVFNSL